MISFLFKSKISCVIRPSSSICLSFFNLIIDSSSFNGGVWTFICCASCCPNGNPTPNPIPPVPNPRRKRYYFNYQDAINALNKKGCPTGGGGEEGNKEDSFADDWRATENKTVDTTVSADNFSNWSN